MFEKLKAFYSVFTAGQSVVHAVRLKKVQAYGGLFAGFIGAALAVAKGFGYVVPLTDEQVISLGTACAVLFGLFNAGATVASTDKIGLPSLEDQESNADNAEHISWPRISTESTSTDVSLALGTDNQN